MTVGEKIKKRRQEIGLTQDELAYKCNVSRQTVYKWENDIALPETNNLPILVSLLDLSYEELLGKTECVNYASSNNFSHNSHDDYNARYDALTTIETGVKKHWQKVLFALPIGGIIFIFLGILSRVLFSVFFNAFNSKEDEFNGYGHLFPEYASEQNSVSSSAKQMFSIMSTTIICIGALMLVIGIIAIVYDRKKMKKYNN